MDSCYIIQLGMVLSLIEINLLGKFAVEET
jgi:hypothetical protein